MVTTLVTLSRRIDLIEIVVLGLAIVVCSAATLTFAHVGLRIITRV